jgi:ribulose 1,5-bisphosphate synthetase/thiazole synthase
MTARTTPADRIEADVVVIGGGSAGCVVVRRVAGLEEYLQTKTVFLGVDLGCAD